MRPPQWGQIRPPCPPRGGLLDRAEGRQFVVLRELDEHRRLDAGCLAHGLVPREPAQHSRQVHFVAPAARGREPFKAGQRLVCSQYREGLGWTGDRYNHRAAH